MKSFQVAVRVSAACAAALVVACSTNSSVATLTDGAKIAELERELSTPTMDLSRVTVAYLKVDTQNIQVASIMPVVLGEAKSGRQTARSLVRITPDHKGLTLYTHDVRKKSAYTITVPFAEFANQKVVAFPVIGPTGALVEKKIALDKTITR